MSKRTLKRYALYLTEKLERDIYCGSFNITGTGERYLKTAILNI